MAVWRRIPGSVWALGVTSLFMDTASEAIHALLPVFMVGTLGASPAILGLLEGVAEGVTSVTKLFSGVVSDRFRAHKAITIAGYAIAALSKPIFAVAPTVGWVFAARAADRFGKGVRGAPRDALIAELTDPEIRGAAYGLRQSLDTVGGLLGPLMAMGLMLWLGFGPREVFWAATIPAVLAVIVLWLGVKNPPQVPEKDSKSFTDIWRGAGGLPSAFWAVTLVGGALTMARFSEAFLILKTQDAGLGLALLPVVLIVMNVVYAATAFPAGALADRMPPAALLAMGCAVLMAADAVLAMGTSVTVTLVGVALWGLHMGLTQGVLAALIAAVAPQALRATAFGMFYLVLGFVTVASSALAGVLWDRFGSGATFVAGAGFSAVALLGALVLGARKQL